MLNKEIDEIIYQQKRIKAIKESKLNIDRETYKEHIVKLNKKINELLVLNKTFKEYALLMENHAVFFKRASGMNSKVFNSAKKNSPLIHEETNDTQNM